MADIKIYFNTNHESMRSTRCDSLFLVSHKKNIEINKNKKYIKIYRKLST